MNLELHEHQQIAVAKMHNGCVLAGDVGTGKTITALAYAMTREMGKHIYVITTAKKRDSGDWEREAALLGVKFDGITVDSWNNISNYLDIENAVFVFDEQRLVGTGTWVQSFYKIAKYNRWVLLSATPGDTWLDYVPVFIANGFYKNITEFRNRHVVYARYSKFPKVQRYLDEGRLQRLRKQILVEMPMVRHTTRHIEMVEVDYDASDFEQVWKRRWNVFEDQPIKDAGELFRVGRKVVGLNQSRLEAVKCLMEKHPKLIVFYNFDYELEMLRTLGQTTASSTSMTSPSSSSLESSDPAVISEVSTPNAQSQKDVTTSGASLEGTIWEEGWNEDLWKKAHALGLLSKSSDSMEDTHSGTGGVIPWDQLESTTGESWPESGKSTGSVDPLRRTSSNTSTNSGPTSDDTLRDTSLEAKSFAVAEWNGHKHEPIPTTDRWVYLVQYTSGSEGWNCIDTDAMVFFSLTYSYKQFYQSQGRIDRMNTSFEDLHYYVLMTKSIVDKAVWRALQQKKDFNVRGFK